jgi:hypothetical protein
MSQYKNGTASVSKGSSVVTGKNTLWLANVAAGHGFKIQGEKAVYTINAVDGDGTLQISPPYAGSDKADVTYLVWRDFTANVGLYEPSAGDVEWPFLLTQTFRKLDSILAGTPSYGSPFGVITLCGLDNGANLPGVALQAEIDRLIDSGVAPEKIVWFSTGTENVSAGEVGAIHMVTAAVTPLAGSLALVGSRSGVIPLAAAALTPLAGTLTVTGVQAGVGSIPLATALYTPVQGGLAVGGKQTGLIPLVTALASPSAGLLDISGIATTIPSFVNGVIVSGSTVQINVSWNYRFEATSYNVYYNTANTLGTATKVSGITDTSASIPVSFSDGDFCYVWVSAQNSAGEGPKSNVTIMQLFAPPTTGAVPMSTASFTPSAGSLTVVGKQTGSLALATALITPAAGSLGIVGKRTGLIALATATVTPSVGSLTVAGVSASPPAQVTGVTASNSPAQITVNWTAVSGATGYSVYYSTTNNSTGATKLSNATAGTSYTLKVPLVEGTTYYTWVSAVNGAGEGPLSASASAVAGAVPGAIPINPGFESVETSSGALDNWQFGAWGDGIGTGGLAVSERVATTEMTGSYAHRVAAYAGGDEEVSYGCQAEALYAFSKAALDASTGIVTFDIRPKIYYSLGSAYITVQVYDAVGTTISKQTSAVNLSLYGDNWFGGNTAIYTDPVTPDVTLTKSFNIKNFAVNSCLVAGKTWADVARVEMAFFANGDAPNYSAADFYIDNFR